MNYAQTANVNPNKFFGVIFMQNKHNKVCKYQFMYSADHVTYSDTEEPSFCDRPVYYVTEAFPV